MFIIRVDPPLLFSLAPTSGLVASSVTITGRNFGPAQENSRVTFNGTTTTATAWSSTSITVPVPTGATTGPVVVTVGGRASNPLSYTVTAPPAPTLTNLSVTSGAVGTTVIATGTNFGSPQGTSTITFNAVAAAVSAWSTTSITCTVPTTATTGPVLVTVGGVNSNSITFTVTTSSFVLKTAANTGLAGAGIPEGSLITNATGPTYGPAFNGQTISGIRFTNGILITGTNITISGCLFELPAGAGSYALEAGAGSSGTIIQDCTFRTSGSATSGIKNQMYNRNGGSWTIQRCDASHAENIITTFGSNTLIQDNYLHLPLSFDPAGHNDTIEVYGGTGIIIRRNTITLDPVPAIQAQSPACSINVAPWTGSGADQNVTNLDILDNYIDGEFWAEILLDSNQAGSHNVTNVRVLRNRLGGHNGGGAYGAGLGQGMFQLSGVNRVATDTAGVDQYYTPSTGPDVNVWFYCTSNPFGFPNLSPDRTGQITF